MTIYQDVLRPYQRVAAARIASQKKLLLADQPGLGKTLEVLAGIELAGLLNPNDAHAVLVLSPLVNARSAWLASMERFIMPMHPHVRLVDLSSGSAQRKNQILSEVLAEDGNHPIVVVANHNSLDVLKKTGARVPALFDVFWSAVVIDESHLVLPIVTPGVKTNFWRGLDKLKYHSAQAAMKIAVSGTPDRGKLEYRFGTWKFVSPGMVGEHWAWLKDHFNVFEQKVSRTRTVKKIGSLKRSWEWLQVDKDLMIRRTKEEVLPELPPKMYNFVELGMSKGQRAAYEARELEARLDFEESKKPTALLVFSTMARQLASYAGDESEKLDWLLEWLDSRGFLSDIGGDGKVVISSQFVKTLEWFEKQLKFHGVNCAMLTGSMSANQRNVVQSRFQDVKDPLRVVLLSGAMGVGIDLDVADDLIMIDLPYDPDRLEQIEDRVHRASNMHQVTIWHLLTRDSIDMAIAEVCTTRRFETRRLLDGSRGVDFSRKVVQALTQKEEPIGNY